MNKRWKDLKAGDEIFVVELYNVSSSINYIHTITAVAGGLDEQGDLRVVYESDMFDHQLSFFVLKEYLNSTEMIYEDYSEYHLTQDSVVESIESKRRRYQKRIDNLDEIQNKFTKECKTNS